MIPFLGVKVGMKAKQKNLVNSMHRGANGILSHEMVSLQPNILTPFDPEGHIDLFLQDVLFQQKSFIDYPKD